MSTARDWDQEMKKGEDYGHFVPIELVFDQYRTDVELIQCPKCHRSLLSWDAREIQIDCGNNRGAVYLLRKESVI
jgi:Zn-finger nucleic acid-binding protein